MKLDVNVLRYLSKDDFRVLTAVELGMRNHEIVPAVLIDRIAALKHGGSYKVLRNLLKHKLLHHDASRYDGFRLTYLGYDFLAIKSLCNRGVFVSVGRQIGVGKESDIFEVATEDGTILAMKLHRLGRVSFRAVKAKRDYLRHRSSFNWLYLSRLAALKEFSFMKALEEHDFPVPNAIDCNRHCVIMSLVQGFPFVQVRELQNPEIVFETIISIVVRLAEHGLIHCDFNEFNIMIDDNEKITVIDFPQMVSVSHRNAQMYFDRDVECIFKYFKKRFNLTFREETDANDGGEVHPDGSSRPCFSSIEKDSSSLDKELYASGFTKNDQEKIEMFIEGGMDGSSDDEDSDEEKTTDKIANTDKTADQNSNNDEIDDKTVLQRSNDDKAADEGHISEVSEANTNDLDSLQLQEEEEDNPIAVEDDPELMKRLNKQRRQAIARSHGGQRSSGSRNSYKQKGAKSGAKVQLQMSGW